MHSARPRPSDGLTAASGFSLVEVLIATGLLATVIASLAQLFAVATRANLDAGDTTWATVLAAQKIEELRAEPFPGPFVDQSVDYLDSGGNRLDDPGSMRPAYTRRWWIEPLSSAPDNTIAITVSVSRYRRGDGGTPDPAPLRDAARLVTLRTRKAP
jgi:Tfp pilus assembly protein PilV